MKRIFTVVTFFLLILNSMMAREEVKITESSVSVAKDLEIRYELSFPEPQTHYVEVTMEISNLDQDTIDLKMPVWTPGSYLIREFPKNVDFFTAKDGSKLLPSHKVSKNTWRVVSKDVSTLTVSYKVYSFEMSVRTSFIDIDKAYMNGTSIFMFPKDGLHLESTVKFNPYPGWEKLSTSLKGKGWERKAENYDILFDSPILIGNQQIVEFEAEGIPHIIAVEGIGNYDLDKMKKDFIQIVKTETAMFKHNPCDEYTFIVLSTENNYGGLEHLNSSSMIFPRWSFEPQSSYNKFLSLVMHEYFHLWNIKRIRPKTLGPFDYESENYTNLLWVAEGFTSYYDEYLMRRAGFISANDYFKMIEKVFNYCENTPGRHVQSLADASFDAWIKYYRKNENTDNCCVSYYQKGAGVAVLLDLAIRNATKGKKSLDDVMRILYTDFYQAKDVGFTDVEMQKVIKDVAGVPCTEFFDSYIYGTGQLNYNKYLNFAGLELVDGNSGNNSPFLGLNTKKKDDKLVVTFVDSEGPSWDADINVNDEIIAINEFRVGDKISDWISKYKVGEKVKLLISRAGLLREVEITLENNPKSKFRVVKMKNATSEQKELFEGWMDEKF